MDYPKEVLRDVYWAFREPTFDTIEEFIRDLKDYHRVISGESLKMDFNSIVFDFKEVVIQYVKYTDDDIEEPQVKLTADNGQNFSYKELLYKLHNHVGIDLFEDDNCFFEGLTFSQDDDPDFPDIPVYFLDTGS